MHLSLWREAARYLYVNGRSLQGLPIWRWGPPARPLAWARSGPSLLAHPLAQRAVPELPPGHSPGRLPMLPHPRARLVGTQREQGYPLTLPLRTRSGDLLREIGSPEAILAHI